jgi:hypothetical protein
MVSYYFLSTGFQESLAFASIGVCLGFFLGMMFVLFWAEETALWTASFAASHLFWQGSAHGLMPAAGGSRVSVMPALTTHF